MRFTQTFTRTGLACSGLLLALLAGLSACGGGGASSNAGSSASPQAAAAGTTSSGVITAFGSVFVGGHEFATGNARFIDDDTGSSTTSATGLEVGMVVDVKPAAGSSAAAPDASELHIHPLARGYVDAADSTAGTLQVMGQTVQLTSSTNFSDHRACLSTTPATCSAITGPAGLVANAGTASSYVGVHGYLYGSGSGTANIVATLVAVHDVPSTPTVASFKAEGLATVSGASVSIGALTLDLSTANCYVARVLTPCNTAFATGQVVSAGASTAPALPATSLVANFARLASRIAVDTAGTAVEMEGVVSSVAGSSLVVRGVSIDTSALPSGSSLPAVGDAVRVLGTLASNGQSVSATNLVILHAAASSKLGLQGDASAIAAGSAANTYTLQLLGQTVTVNAQTRLMDMSVRGWDHRDPASNPFNTSTFASYMAASVSKHVIVKAEASGSGTLVATSLAIVPASSVTAVAGLVDSAPAVVNSPATGTPSSFSIHGIAISADPAAVLAPGHHGTGLVSIAAGDQVVAVGTWVANALTVAATPTASNQVLDAGAPRPELRDRGEF